MEVSAAEPGDLDVDVLGVPVADPPDVSRLDERIRPRLEGISELSGETGSTVVVHLNGEVKAARVAAVGVGSAPDADSIRTAAAAVARAAARVGGSVGWAIDPSLGVPEDVQARAAVEGIAYGAYRPGRWKSKDAAREISRVVVAGRGEGVRAAAERAAVSPPGWTGRATSRTHRRTSRPRSARRARARARAGRTSGRGARAETEIAS